MRSCFYHTFVFFLLQKAKDISQDWKHASTQKRKQPYVVCLSHFFAKSKKTFLKIENMFRLFNQKCKKPYVVCLSHFCIFLPKSKSIAKNWEHVSNLQSKVQET